MNTLVCHMILATITSRASDDIKKLWVIEGNRIELPAPSAVDKVTNVESLNWFYGNGTHANNTIVTLVDPNKGPFSIDGTKQKYGDLIIEPVYRTDTGYYTCQVVEKDVYTSWESTSYLVVYYMDPPTISTNWSTENSHATFFCIWSKTYPEKPIVKWFLNGRELKTTKTRLILCEEERKATLVILNISEEDFGNYTCSITKNTNKGVMNKISKGLLSNGLPVEVGLSTLNHTVPIVAAVTSFILGFFPTCLICHCIRKHERENRHKFRRQNQALHSRSGYTRAHGDVAVAARNSWNVENWHPL